MMRFAAVSLLVGCSTTRALAPLDAGQGALAASFGGPIVEVSGKPIPLPVTTIGYAHGLDGRTNLHGAVHPSTVAFFGFYGFDVGLARQIVEPDGARPRVMADLTAYTFFGDLAGGEPKGGLRVFPDVSIVASWPVSRRVVPYAGLDQFVQVAPELHYVPSLLGGAEIRGERLGVQLETKWVAPTTDTEPLVPHWYGIGRHGALALQVGLNVYLGEGAP